MGNLFVSEGLVKPYVVATYSALLKSKSHVVWHASSMREGKGRKRWPSPIQELIQMQGGTTVILKDEYLIWIQAAHDIMY
ncbi:hypothetical protein BH23THE1_BH23THE1_10990 [soil metagenome]